MFVAIKNKKLYYFKILYIIKVRYRSKLENKIKCINFVSHQDCSHLVI